MLIDLHGIYIIINDTPAGSTSHLLCMNFLPPYDALITNNRGKVDISAVPSMVHIPHIFAMGNMNSPTKDSSQWTPWESEKFVNESHQKELRC